MGSAELPAGNDQCAMTRCSRLLTVYHLVSVNDSQIGLVQTEDYSFSSMESPVLSTMLTDRSERSVVG